MEQRCERTPGNASVFYFRIPFDFRISFQILRAKLWFFAEKRKLCIENYHFCLNKAKKYFVLPLIAET